MTLSTYKSNQLWKTGEKIRLNMVSINPCLESRRRRRTRLARQVDQQTEGHRQMDEATVSLDNLEVVQDGHDVLRHKDIAGINSHAGH